MGHVLHGDALQRSQSGVPEACRHDETARTVGSGVPGACGSVGPQEPPDAKCTFGDDARTPGEVPGRAALGERCILGHAGSLGRPNGLGRPSGVSQVPCAGSTYFKVASAACALATDSECVPAWWSRSASATNAFAFFTVSLF